MQVNLKCGEKDFAQSQTNTKEGSLFLSYFLWTKQGKIEKPRQVQ